ncbi:MAG TPA: hypothetical protein VH307_05580 [Streptosporangiaceae bacterium]|nr:hypothetical protein [Streptosporangiaceae bacterium]
MGYPVSERLDVHDQQHAANEPDADRHADPDADRHADINNDRYRNAGT